jgi:ABC-type nitrate/sulfonate/bicarbonate transport system substrate-binding protein
MTFSIKKLTRVACAGAACILLAAGLASGANAADSEPTITVAAPPIDAAGEIFYATDMGFFKQAGLNVKLATLNKPGPILAAVASGAVTIGSAPVSVLALARAKGIPLVMIASGGLYLSSSPTSGIIVLKNSPLKNAADLSSKTLATRDLSDLSYFGAKLWIDKNGGNSDTIHWVELPDPEDEAALEARRIDAGSVSAPVLDNALRGGKVRTLAPIFDAIADRFLISGYVTTEAFADAHPELIRKFSETMAKAAAWGNTHQTESAKILEKYAHAPVRPGSVRITYAPHLRAADVQPVLDLLTHYNLLKKPMSPTSLFSIVIATK